MQNTNSHERLFSMMLKAFVLLCIVELSLRVLPACEQPFVVYDMSDKVLLLDKNVQRDGVYTDGNLAQIKANWHVNNKGWNSSYDYESGGAGKPIIAVIGNSYVEGRQVDSDKNVVAKLQEQLMGSYSCYNFGISGGKLSTYLQISRYVHKNYNPKIIVVNIVDGDILDSLVENERQAKDSLLLINTPAGIAELPAKPYKPSSVKRFFRKFALVRYFYLNKQAFTGEIIPITSRKADKSLPVDQTDKIQRISDFTFGKLKNENPNSTIIIVLDAPRDDIYRGTMRKINVEYRKLVSNIAYKYGFHVVDLTTSLTNIYAKNNKQFDFDNNNHWNEYGHQIVSNQIYNYMLQARIVTPVKNHKLKQ
jgi:hypothetical protein